MEWKCHCFILSIQQKIIIIIPNTPTTKLSHSEIKKIQMLLDKGSRNILFYLRKLSRNWGPFFSTALVKGNSWHIKCLLLTQYLKVYFKFAITFLSKKYTYIFLDTFLCNFMRPKTSENYLSILTLSNVYVLQIS